MNVADGCGLLDDGAGLAGLDGPGAEGPGCPLSKPSTRRFHLASLFSASLARRISATFIIDSSSILSSLALVASLIRRAVSFRAYFNFSSKSQIFRSNSCLVCLNLCSLSEYLLLRSSTSPNNIWRSTCQVSSSADEVSEAGGAWLLWDLAVHCRSVMGRFSRDGGSWVYSYMSFSSSSARNSSSSLVLGAVVPRVERRTGARFFTTLEPLGRPVPLLSSTAGMIDRSLGFSPRVVRQVVGPTIESNEEELWGDR